MNADVLLRVFGVGVGVLFLVGLVLVIGSYTFLPAVFEGVLKGRIQDRLELQTTPEVSLSSEPPPNILVGKFESGRVVLKNADFEELRPQKAVIDLDPFDLNLLGSIRNGSFKSEKPLSGRLQIELSEKEVVRLANAGNRRVTVENVRLEPGQMTVGLQTAFMGANVPVSVVGTLELDGRSLVFNPRRILAFGIPLPKKVSDQLASRSGFEYPLDDLPYDTDVSDIRVEEGKVVVVGRIGRIPVDATGG